MNRHVEQFIAGEWIAGEPAVASVDPATGEVVATAPATTWTQIDEAVTAGDHAHRAMVSIGPEPTARFLDDLATRLTNRADELVDAATRETGLPARPRLADVELPRTTDQLRQAAHAARTRNWTRPTISTGANVRSMLTPLPGPVVTLGPSNFPFAFNSVCGGDAAAAWATGHSVIAKAHPAHILTSYLIAREVAAASAAADLPAATLQLLYDVRPTDGLRMVADRRIAATAFTGSRATGLSLKAAADAAGVPIFLEMSSVNPVVVLPGAAADHAEEIGRELAASVTSGVGQFCTKPGVVFVLDDADGRRALDSLAHSIAADRGGLLMTTRLRSTFDESVAQLLGSGAATLATGSQPERDTGVAARLFTVTAADFLARSADLQTEVFGPAILTVPCGSIDELTRCLELVEGSLAAAVYMTDADGDGWAEIGRALMPRVGRIVVNRPPTGVKVVAAMNHGGPYPSTGHPGTTAVGIPRSLERFAKLTCFDAVPDRHLPPELQDANPLGLGREVDGMHTMAPLPIAPT